MIRATSVATSRARCWSGGHGVFERRPELAVCIVQRRVEDGRGILDQFMRGLVLAVAAIEASRHVGARHGAPPLPMRASTLVARRGVDVVRLRLAMIRVSQTVPGCGQSRVEVAPSARLAFKVKPNYDEVNKGFA